VGNLRLFRRRRKLVTKQEPFPVAAEDEGLLVSLAGYFEESMHLTHQAAIEYARFILYGVRKENDDAG
jgi:hypothetical protein